VCAIGETTERPSDIIRVQDGAYFGVFEFVEDHSVTKVAQPKRLVISLDSPTDKTPDRQNSVRAA
jgi:hypothetical protein